MRITTNCNSHRFKLRLIFFGQDLINWSTFTLCRHSYAADSCDGWREVNFTDDTISFKTFFNTRACGNKNWLYRGICITPASTEGFTMIIVIPFSIEVNNITALRASEAKQNSILVTYCKSNDALTGLFISVSIKTSHDFFFPFILIFWINDTVIISAFQVQIDVICTRSNSIGMFPINRFHIIAIFIFFQCSQPELLHDTNVNTHNITDQWEIMGRANLSMVTHNRQGPSFIEQMDKLTNVIVSLNINIFSKLLEFFRRKDIFTFIRHITNNHMHLKINCMEMREDHLNIFVFDQIIQRSRLPVRTGVPVCQHNILNQFWILQAIHSRRSWVTNIFSNGLKQRFRMPNFI